jgi:hypothetical protein
MNPIIFVHKDTTGSIRSLTPSGGSLTGRITGSILVLRIVVCQEECSTSFVQLATKPYLARSPHLHIFTGGHAQRAHSALKR